MDVIYYIGIFYLNTSGIKIFRKTVLLFILVTLIAFELLH